MSRSWRGSPSLSLSLRVGLCPDRLVTAQTVLPIKSDPVTAMKEIAGDAKLSVVLSNHFVRYAVLPWSAGLTSDEEWQAFAQHSFTSTYGNAAAGWEIRISRTGFRRARIASGVDRALLESLRSISSIASVQPYLMSAFNRRQSAFGKRSAWFVLQEQGRITLCLIAKGTWLLIRSRQVQGDWRHALPDLLDRELALSGAQDCDQALICAESEPPQKLGRYRVCDITLRPDATRGTRACAMALD